MTNKGKVVIDTLEKLLEEVIDHNADYHHITTKEFIGFVEDMITKLKKRKRKFDNFRGEAGDFEKRS